VDTAEESVVLAEMNLLIFAFLFAFETFSCLILLFIKTTKKRMILPLHKLSMHASEFLVPERPIAEF
jgi:hypothetical protein